MQYHVFVSVFMWRRLLLRESENVKPILHETQKMCLVSIIKCSFLYWTSMARNATGATYALSLILCVEIFFFSLVV